MVTTNNAIGRAFGRTISAAALMVGLTAAPALAGPITFNLGGNAGEGPGPGNQISVTNGGVTVYATAWYANTNTFAKAALGQWSSGMGTCNGAEDGANGSNGSFPCDSPYHAVDNSGQRDFILFLFSAPVDLTSLTVNQIANDADVSYWLGNVAGGASQTDLLTGHALNNMPAGFGSRLDNNGNSRTFMLDALTNTYNALLVGGSLASTNDYDDYFKLKTLFANYTPEENIAQTPEPGSLILLGLGLIGAAAISRRQLHRR